MRLSNSDMEVSTAWREVWITINLCCSSLCALLSEVISKDLDTASNSFRSLVLLLWHLFREDDASLHLLSLYASFSRRTRSITSSYQRDQMTLGTSKYSRRCPWLCLARTKDLDAAGSPLRAMSSLCSHTATCRVLAQWSRVLTSVSMVLGVGIA